MFSNPQLKALLALATLSVVVAAAAVPAAELDQATKAGISGGYESDSKGTINTYEVGIILGTF